MISKAVLTEELSMAQRVLTKWLQKIQEGIPGSDLPATEYDQAAWIGELIGESLLMSAKLQALAEVLERDNG